MKKTPYQASQVARCDSTGKKKSTHAQAMKEVQFMKRNKKYPDLMPNAYFHKACGWWHVGNTTL